MPCLPVPEQIYILSRVGFLALTASSWHAAQRGVPATFLRWLPWPGVAPPRGFVPRRN